MDPWTQLVVLLGQLLFYGGLLMLLCGLPLFIWLAVRACRDLHRIADHIEAVTYRYDPPTPAQQRYVEQERAARSGVANSAFGR